MRLKTPSYNRKNALSMKISIIYTDSKKEAITTFGEFLSHLVIFEHKQIDII